MRNIFTFDRSVPYTRPAKRPAHHNTRAPKPEEFTDEINRLPDFEDLADFDFDALTSLERRQPITDALARLLDFAGRIAEIEVKLAIAYQSAEQTTSLHTAEEIPFMSEDGLQAFDVANELRRAIWHFSQAIDRPALDRAITAVQLAELHSDFRQ